MISVILGALSVGGSIVVGGSVGIQLSVGRGPVHGVYVHEKTSHQKTQQITLHRLA